MSDEPIRRRYGRFWGADPRRDVDEEIEFHLAMRMDELRRAGLSDVQAREETMHRFGDLEQVRDECRELGRRRVSRHRRAGRLEALQQEVRFAMRALAAHRAFTIVTALTMALGIGATTAVFSVAYGVLLRPLPFRDAGALVRLWSRNDPASLEFFSVSPPDYQDWRSSARSFSQMAAFERQRDATLIRRDLPELIETTRVTPEIFTLLGATVHIGRTVVAADVEPGAPPVAVLAYDTWATRFGSDSTVIGTDLRLDGQRYAIVGVMPRRFLVPGTPAQLWTPLSMRDASSDHGNRYLRVLARLTSGVTIERARDEMRTITGRLAAAYPATNTNWSISIMSVPEMIIGPQFRRAVMVLTGVVGFVLLIACANAANLQLARAAARRKEIAVRAALGATRGRVIVQLLVESLVLAVLAGVAGLVLAYGGVAALRVLGTETVPRLGDVQLDGPVLAFTAAITIASGLLFGLLPAVRASRTDVGEVLKEGTRGSTGGVSSERVRSALVVAEVTLSLVLLIGAGLLGRSFLKLQAVDLGFDPRGVSVVSVRLDPTVYPQPERLTAFHEAWLEQARRLPGVTEAAQISNAPFNGPNSGSAFVRTDRAIDRKGAVGADYRVISPGLLHALAIPLRRGRDIGVEDRRTSPLVVLISETMARRGWPNEDPIGKAIRVGDVVKGPVFTVVGVVGDVRYQSIETPDTRPMMYFAAAQNPQRAMTVVMRGATPAALSAAMRRIVTGLDPSLATPQAVDLDDRVGLAFATPRFALVLFIAFAGAAVVLAMVGMYGVMSYLVRQRLHEMGIRIALGAPARTLVTSVVVRALRLALIGVALGLIGARFLTRFLSTLLFGVEPIDWLTFLVIGTALVGVAVVASLLPARRATRADPLTVLRGDGG